MTPVKAKHLRRKYSGDDKPSLSKEQLKAFLEAAKATSLRDFAMFLTGVLHGMRAQEIVNLRVSDISLADGAIVVRGVKKGKVSHESLKALNGWDEKTVLAAYLAERAEKEGAANSDALFLSAHSNPDGSRRGLDRVQVFRRFQAIARLAGLPPSVQHPHTLRHTIGFLSVEAGVPLVSVQKILRHRSIASTAVYCAPQRSTVDNQVSQMLQKLF